MGRGGWGSAVDMVWKLGTTGGWCRDVSSAGARGAGLISAVAAIREGQTNDHSDYHPRPWVKFTMHTS